MKIASLVLLATTLMTPLATLKAETVVLRSEDKARSETWKRRLWKGSLALLATATVVDAHSSWGGRELNPVLRGADGRFGTQGVMVKTGLALGILTAQQVILHQLNKNPNASGKAYTAFTITNAVSAAALGAAAAHNYGVRK